MHDTETFNLGLWLKNQGYDQPYSDKPQTYTLYRVSGEGVKKYRKTISKAQALLESLVLGGYERLDVHEIVRSRADDSVIGSKLIDSVRPFYG